MAPLPVIADVFRVAITGTLSGGVKPINVIHIHNPSGDVTDLADKINDVLPLSMWLPVPSAMQAVQMAITPLDGTSATSLHPLTGWNADGDADFIPEGCAVVSLRSTQRGPRGRGRVFVGPIGEGSQNSGIITPSNRTDLATAWNDFSTGLAAGGTPMSLGIASYVHADFHTAETITVDSGMGTQRRRLLQQR